MNKFTNEDEDNEDQVMEVDDDNSHQQQQNRFAKSKVGVHQQKKKDMLTQEEVTEKQAVQELEKFIVGLRHGAQNQFYVDDALSIVQGSGLLNDPIFSGASKKCGNLFGNQSLKTLLEDLSTSSYLLKKEKYSSYLQTELHPQVIGASIETMVSGGTTSYTPPDNLFS